MWLIAVGLGLIGGAAALFFARQGLETQVKVIKLTDTSTVAELENLSQTIVAELGNRGAFKEQVEVKGTIHCSNPLTAQLSERPCVYYQAMVQEKYEETYYETDSDGNRQRKTRTGYTSLANNSLKINFQVTDQTGTIQVNPNDAEIEAIEVVDRFESYQNQTQLSVGSFRFQISPQGLARSGSGDKRILGYQYNEWILPLDIPVYVLGEIDDGDGTLTIGKPSQEDHKFLITHKSEEALIADKEAEMRDQNIASIVCLGLGIVALIVGLVSLL
jgi:hypothetical protein